MNIDAYINPDFTWYKKCFFFLITVFIISMCVLGIAGVEKILAGKNKRDDWEEIYSERLTNHLQRFFEMIIAGTSVMMFSCAYVVINHIFTLISSGSATADRRLFIYLVKAWSEGKDFVLLILICFSCFFNSFLDRLLIPLNKLAKEEKATMRMLGMFYVIIILIYLNHIGDESQYSPVTMYYFGLMIGRFVYFDASFMDFIEAIKNCFFNLPFLILTLTVVGILCAIGFNMGFFLERNYYIVGIFYAHLFMLFCVFLNYWTYRLFTRKKN